jgi:hypothetical protein
MDPRENARMMAVDLDRVVRGWMEAGVRPDEVVYMMISCAAVVFGKATEEEDGEVELRRCAATVSVGFCKSVRETWNERKKKNTPE